MNSPKQRILNSAIAALQRSTGAKVQILPSIRERHPPDAIVEFEFDRRKYRFGAEVKTIDRFQTPAMMKCSESGQHPLLVAPYISRQVAERCRQLDLPFIDTAGNAYLSRKGLLVYLTGQPRPLETPRDKFRALNPAGLQIVFLLLCRPEMVNRNYREIAAQASVALGTVSPVMKDLESRGFLRVQAGRDRQILDSERLAEEWVLHYPVTLRPKLNARRFRAEPERLRDLKVGSQGALWGGEFAAEKLTQYLKTEFFTIYAHEPIARLVASGRMRAETDGNLDILDQFWNFPPDSNVPELVPPLLVYADLVATHDGRNAETARMIYEQRIRPALKIAQ
jgi:hypothetical protein